MASETNMFSVRWPKAGDHRTKSLSGVMVESNLQRQIALHFYNEFREMEAEVQYDEQGARNSPGRGIVYVREVTDTLLIGDSAALQLRDVLNTLFPEKSRDPVH